MDAQQEFSRFVARVKAVNDWAVLAFVFVSGVFCGSLISSLLPLMIIGATVALILAAIWIGIDAFTKKEE